MKKRMALILCATALAAGACSSSSKDGSNGLPSIADVSPTAVATTDTPTPAPASSEASASVSDSSSASPGPSSTASATASTSASPSASTQSGTTCLSSNLTLALGEGQGAAGSQIVPLIFTNVGPTTCTLGGYPGISYVTGDSGTQVGAAAVRNGSAGSAVSLVPKATAQTLVKMANTENFPADTCKPVTVRGLRVYPPGQTAALYVALPEGTTACSGSGASSQLSVQSVTSAS